MTRSTPRQMAAYKHQALATIKRRDGTTKKQLEAAIGTKHATTLRLINRLRKAGLIYISARTGHGSVFKAGNLPDALPTRRTPAPAKVPVDSKVLELIATKPHTAHELMLALGVTIRTIRSALARMTGVTLAYDLGRQDVRHYRLIDAPVVVYRPPIKRVEQPYVRHVRRARPTLASGPWAGL